MTNAPIPQWIAGIETANRLNFAPLAIRFIEIGPEEATIMRTIATMSDSPVARCICRHIYSAHNGSCQRRIGRGTCKCPSFQASEFQPHTETMKLLQDSIRLWGFAPTVRELAQSLGVSSSATMRARLAVLEDAGLIERVGPRAIRLIEGTS